MSGSIKSKVIAGLSWKFAERITAQSVSFIVSTALARILTPDDYGVVAIVLIFISLANVFLSNGFNTGLIQKKDAKNIDFSTTFYCTLAISIVLYVILFISAPFIANFYNNQLLSPIIRVLGIKLPITAFNSVQQAYVARNMLFKRFFFSTLFGTLISGIIGIILALNGFGAWALVAQYLINSTVDTLVLFLTISWKPKLLFDRVSAKRLFSYSWKITAGAMMNELYNECRSLIIGRLYPPADLAYYNKGNQFPSLIVVNVETSISSVLFPAMSNYSDDQTRVKQMTRRAIRLSSFIMWPLMSGLAMVANPFISILLTDKWLFCVPFLQLACVNYMFQPINSANMQAIKAIGKSDVYLKLEIIKKIMAIMILLFVMQLGVYAIAISAVVITLICTILNVLPNIKYLNYGYRELITDVLPNLFCTIIMCIAVYVGNRICFHTAWLQLIFGILIGGVVYFIVSMLTKNDSLIYILDMLLKRKKM